MRTIAKTLCTDLLLTGTATAATNTLSANGRDQHTLFVEYSPDTNSTNALQVTIEMSPDGTNWYPFTGEWSAATGTITPGAQVILSYASAGTTAQTHVPYFFNGACQEIRVKVAETNTPADYGNVTIQLFSAHS